MSRVLNGEESEKAAWAIGTLVEFCAMMLNGNFNFTDETFKVVAEAERYLTKNFTPAEQIDLFLKAISLEEAE